MRRALEKGSSLPMTRARLPLRPALVNQWAHLGLNQGPLACESGATVAACRRLLPNPRLPAGLAFHASEPAAA
jgi:hypothetical protein